MNAALEMAAGRHVTVVAASCDIGVVGRTCGVTRGACPAPAPFTPVKEVNLLASDPLVLGAGGTSLTASHTTGACAGEAALGRPDAQARDRPAGRPAAGSAAVRPARLPGARRRHRRTRGVPDVSADAS